MVETLDLRDEIESLGGTNIEIQPPPPDIAPQPQKESEKNIDTNKKTIMDSTPINEIMEQMPQEMPMAPMAPMAPQAAPQAAPMIPAQQPQAVAPATSPMKSKNPMNLTDEQMDALVAAVSALIAFSAPAQERLGSFVPNFEVEGTRTMTGMLVSGMFVAVVFFLVRRFVLKQY